MATASDPHSVSPHATPEHHELRSNWIWFVILGIGLVILGLLALDAAVVMVTLGTVIFFGVLLLIGGVGQVLHAFWARRWRGFFLHLLLGILALIIGLLFVSRPIRGAADLTLLMAAFFTVAGCFRIGSTLAVQFHQWGWSLLAGVVDVVLGVLIWNSWPESSLWVIGTFVGIDLIFTGWTYIMLGLAAKSLPAHS